MSYQPTPDDAPFHRLGGEAGVRAIVERFYDLMHEGEPALARLHPVDDEGRVARPSRDRFALFFIGWLGGPEDYQTQYGHPRLRMRHARVPVDPAMRDAWLRCMIQAVDESDAGPAIKAWLAPRLADVAGHLLNRPG